MKRFLRKVHTLLFTLDLKWLVKFAHKRGWQRFYHIKSKITSGRSDVDVNVDGTRLRLSTLTPYHHSIATTISTGRYETAPMQAWLKQIPGKRTHL